MAWFPGKVIYSVLLVLAGLTACTCPIIPARIYDSAPTDPQQVSPTSIHGTVRDPNTDQPVAGAQIQLWLSPYANRTGDQSTVTDANGTFTFEPVEVGLDTSVTITLIYNAVVQHLYRSGVETLENPEFNFQVSIDAYSVAGDLGWYALTGQVIDAISGNPIPDAQVNFSHFSYNRSQPPQTVVTDSEGRFTLAPVFIHDTDRSTFIAEKDGYAPTEIWIESMNIYYRSNIELPLEPEDD